ncbi:MAG: isochorismatase family protein [Mycoplasmoidaceae bacterium]
MEAILIIDMQEDFCDYGPFNNLGVLEIDAKIGSFLKNLKNIEKYKIIGSVDYHPYNHISFNFFPIHCVKGTLGQKLLPSASEIKFDLMIKKGTYKWIDNLSPFFNGKRKTALDKFLQRNNIKKVYLAGCIGEICIKQTYLDLEKFGYIPLIIDELTYFRLKNEKTKFNLIKAAEFLKNQ